jgi:hypothetical protein
VPPAHFRLELEGLTKRGFGASEVAGVPARITDPNQTHE